MDYTKCIACIIIICPTQNWLHTSYSAMYIQCAPVRECIGKHNPSVQLEPASCTQYFTNLLIYVTIYYEKYTQVYTYVVVPNSWGLQRGTYKWTNPTYHFLHNKLLMQGWFIIICRFPFYAWGLQKNVYKVSLWQMNFTQRGIIALASGGLEFYHSYIYAVAKT